MSRQAFEELITSIARSIGDKPLDAKLEAFLNKAFPSAGEQFGVLTALCAEGEREGWLMAREREGVKFCRAVKPGGIAGRFSVDIVKVKDVVGPHHIHTTGEIGAVMPISGEPCFDGKPGGWYVYPPNTGHHPTLIGGEAYVLYLLPDGAIEFTGR